MIALLLIFAISLSVSYTKEKKDRESAETDLAEAERKIDVLLFDIRSLKNQNTELAKYQEIVDAHAEAQSILDSAQQHYTKKLLEIESKKELVSDESKEISNLNLCSMESLPNDFVAVDFELFTREKTSVCAVGLVKVRNGVIVQQLYSLISPVHDQYTDESPNTFIHGITYDMVMTAPSFDEFFPFMQAFFDLTPMLCHNKSTEVRVLAALMKHYNLPALKITGVLDTFEMHGCGLDSLCERFGIDMGKHHNALDDALACAKVYMRSVGGTLTEPKPSKKQKRFMKAPADAEARRVDRDVLKRPDLDSVEDKSTPFYGAKVVITGTFPHYPSRNDLAKRLKSLGADINTTISGKTDIVVLGEGAGPSKMEKVAALAEKGHSIRLILEDELIKILGD